MNDAPKNTAPGRIPPVTVIGDHNTVNVTTTVNMTAGAPAATGEEDRHGRAIQRLNLAVAVTGLVEQAVDLLHGSGLL